VHGREFVQKSAVEKGSPSGEFRSTRALTINANRSDNPAASAGFFLAPSPALNLKEMDQ
jgi:hypothetical protein